MEEQSLKYDVNSVIEGSEIQTDDVFSDSDEESGEITNEHGSEGDQFYQNQSGSDSNELDQNDTTNAESVTDTHGSESETIDGFTGGSENFPSYEGNTITERSEDKDNFIMTCDEDTSVGMKDIVVKIEPSQENDNLDEENTENNCRNEVTVTKPRNKRFRGVKNYQENDMELDDMLHMYLDTGHIRSLNQDMQHTSKSCSECLLGYMSMKKLVKHEETHHHGVRMQNKFVYFCNICYRLFKSEMFLDLHSTTHSPDANRSETLHSPLDMKLWDRVDKDIEDSYVAAKEIKQNEQLLQTDPTGVKEISRTKSGKFKKVKKVSKPSPDQDSLDVKKRTHRKNKPNSELQQNNVQGKKESSVTFKCSLCPNRTFRLRQSLKAHVRNFHGTNVDNEKEPNTDTNGKFVCGICNDAFTNKGELHSHKNLMHSDDLRSDEDLEITSDVEKTPVKSVKKYSYTYHGVCDTCGKFFSDVKEHISRMHKKEKRFKCKICEKSFRKRHELASHFMIRHTQSKEHTCDMCGKSVATRRKLSLHIRSVHKTKVKKEFPPCAHCGKEFTSRSGIRYHRNLHSTVKKNCCSICGQTFVTTTHLQRHMMVHSGKKPYVCHMCNNSFTQIGNLKIHLKVHRDVMSAEEMTAMLEKEKTRARVEREAEIKMKETIVDIPSREKLTNEVMYHSDMLLTKQKSTKDEGTCNQSDNLIQEQQSTMDVNWDIINEPV